MVEESRTTAGVTGPLELSWSDVFEEDWEAQVKASYKPLQLTDDLWIIPEWCAELSFVLSMTLFCVQNDMALSPQLMCHGPQHVVKLGLCPHTSMVE